MTFTRVRLRKSKNRNLAKAELYKKAINVCAMPDCPFGLDLEVHHIQPLKSRGKDDFVNFIVLCQACHRRSKLHSQWAIRQIDLLVFKFYSEQKVFGLGITSDEYSDDEFWKLLRNHVYGFSLDVRNKAQEALG